MENLSGGRYPAHKFMFVCQQIRATLVHVYTAQCVYHLRLRAKLRHVCAGQDQQAAVVKQVRKQTHATISHTFTCGVLYTS